MSSGREVSRGGTGEVCADTIAKNLASGRKILLAVLFERNGVCAPRYMSMQLLDLIIAPGKIISLQISLVRVIALFFHLVAVKAEYV
jgi:hypothetical protein